MSFELLQDMFYAAPELWYALGVIFVLLLSLWLACGIKILKLKQRNYFLNRDRERYAETLYASKDGYFAFIYPDEKVNDPRKTIRERCSRRLAVILNLDGLTRKTPALNFQLSILMQTGIVLIRRRWRRSTRSLRMNSTNETRNSSQQMCLHARRLSSSAQAALSDLFWIWHVPALRTLFS